MRGHEQQRQHADKKVWHELESFREDVAAEMKISPELLGPNRRDNDFYRKTIDELSDFRNKGIVSESLLHNPS